MALHPDERPASIEIFNNYLFSGGAMPARPSPHQSAFEIPRFDLFRPQTDAILAWTTAGLLLLSLIGHPAALIYHGLQDREPVIFSQAVFISTSVVTRASLPPTLQTIRKW